MLGFQVPMDKIIEKCRTSCQTCGATGALCCTRAGDVEFTLPIGPNGFTRRVNVAPDLKRMRLAILVKDGEGGPTCNNCHRGAKRRTSYWDREPD